MRFIYGIFLCLLCCTAALPARAGFPFSFRKQEIKTDYSQTVWDRIMLEQSVSDIRRGMGEMAAANYQAASNSFAKAVIKNSKDPLPYLLLGASLYWAGKVDDAVGEYKEALRRDPNNAMAYQLLGIASGWKGNLHEAQNYFLRAYAIDPDKADTNMNLASTYAAEQNWDSALSHLRRSVELAPREPLYHYQLATLYEQLGRDEAAEDAFKKALHFFPRYEDAQLGLGALYEKMGRAQEALKFYKRAVKTKPGDFVARLRYALLLVRQGQTPAAREVIEQAFSITRFKADGLALNAVYRATGRGAQDFEKQIDDFTQNLQRISAAKAINIEVNMEYLPVPERQRETPRQPETFEEAYERLHFSQNEEPAQDNTPRIFRRAFTLVPAEEEQRQSQINALAEGLKDAVRQTDGKQQVNLSLQGRTMDFNSPSALSQNRTAAPRAVYDPRIVGNDMGLWVMGRTWLGFVHDAQEDLQDFSACPPDNTCDLLRGLAELAAGNARAGAVFFERAARQNPQDALALLGQGTAAVIADDEPAAIAFYRRALEAAPQNKVAAKNLKVLSD